MATTRTDALVKGLGLIDSTTLVMGSMIGSGIFIVAADISRQVQSPGLMMMTWVATAFLTLIAALSYGELAAAMPHAGGQYVYLREAFGPLYGFLYGWTLFLVIQTGTIAAVAVAFAKYTGVFVPWISAENYLVGSGRVGLTTQQLLAIAIIVVLSALNTRGIRTGAAVQNTFTFAKIAALAGLIGCGFLMGRNQAAVASNFTGFWRGSGWSFTSVRLVGVAMVGSLFSSDAWNNVTFTAGEVRNPRRNLPLSLGLGVAHCFRIVSFGQSGVSERADLSRNPARGGRSRRHRGCCPHVRTGGRATHGRGHHDLHLRLRQRPDPLRRARLLRHGQRQAVLPARRRIGSQDARADFPSSRSASGRCCCP